MFKFAPGVHLWVSLVWVGHLGLWVSGEGGREGPETVGQEGEGDSRAGQREGRGRGAGVKIRTAGRHAEVPRHW